MSSESKPIDAKDFEIAIRDLTDDNLLSLQTQLENSLERLRQTNKELAQEIDATKESIGKLKDGVCHEDLKNDLIIYSESIEENAVVIANQTERLDVLKKELDHRGLIKPTAYLENGIYL